MRENRNCEMGDAGTNGVSTDGVWPDGACTDQDWNYLRANLDSPRRRLGLKLSGVLAALIQNSWQPRLARRPARLELVARIALGPRQMVALIEAEGSRVLV